MGYNPNRDSGIAFARSFVEVSADKLSGLIEEFEFVPDPTKRYFAQLTYNVGENNSPFTDVEITKLKQLSEISDALIGMSTLSIKSVIIEVPPMPSTDSTESITKTNTFIPVIKVNDTYELVADTDNFDGDEETTYLLNINGYVCGVECYRWLDEVGGEVSPKMDRILPRSTYIPAGEVNITGYPYGRTVIYLTNEEYDSIAGLSAANTTDTKYNVIKVYYIVNSGIAENVL